MFYNDSEFGLIELLQSRRRKISLSIKIDTCSIVIKTPYKLNDTQIAEIIDNHRLWLRKKLSNIKKFDEFKHTFDENDKFMYLGKLYPLEFGDSVGFSGYSFQVKSRGDIEKIKAELEKIYRELARNYLSCHLKFVASKFRIDYNQMRITGASTRWGSCTSAGNINFPWNLIMCPGELVNYVVCHELAHRLQMNHSLLFWQEVYRMCPNYRVFRKILKENSLMYSNF